jgi:transcriptional regulator with PAS, ATPase and Fis domain
VGTPLTPGVSAPRLLCGQADERPVAEALAAGRAVVAEVMRPDGEGRPRVLSVRASPLRTAGETVGWILLLDLPAGASAAGDAAEARWGIATRNARMKRLLHEVARAAQSEAAILVRGETGSGKELVARAIHSASSRRDGPFRALNCAALPESLLESALFGHVRGAFTGAERDEPGHFRLAHGGTLFLDEIAELPLRLQATLLRVLQEKTVIPLGGREPVAVDVRIVSATHRSLRHAVAEGRFRSDLMFRVRVVPLFLPPLRERPEDIELLAWHFVEQQNRHGLRRVSRMTPGASAALGRYDWPGNVRELSNAIEYAFVMGEGAVLTEAELPPEIRGDEPATVTAPATPAVVASPAVPAELGRLLTALERAGGHHGRAAASLGISRSTLWRKLRKSGVGPRSGT